MRISLVTPLTTAVITLLLALPAAAQWRNLPTDGCPPVPTASRTCRRPRREPPRASRTCRASTRRTSVLPEPGRRYRPRERADDAEARKIHAARATGLLGLRRAGRPLPAAGRAEDQQAPVPFKIVQTDKLVVLVYEAFNLWRQVHLDAREFAEDLNPSWMGYSKGRWEGDELVVETRGLNGKQWLDHGGLPASDKLMVVERFRRPNVRSARDPVHDHRPDLLHEAVDHEDERAAAPGHRALRVHLQRERAVHQAHGPEHQVSRAGRRAV